MLFLALKIPVSEEDQHVTFTHWIPEDASNALLVDSVPGFDLRISVRRDCLARAYRYEGDELKRHTNVEVSHFAVDIAMTDVSSELIDYVCSHRHFGNGDSDGHPLEVEYEKLGERIYEVAFHAIDRLLTYARVTKGQYWIATPRYDARNRHQYFLKADAVVSADRQRWRDFNPPPRGFSVIFYAPDKGRFLGPAEWADAGTFVNDRSRVDRVFQILATAEQLEDAQHTRSAVVEAISALELAVGRFLRNPDPEQLAIPASIPIGFDNLRRIWQQHGFTTALSVVLPVLLADKGASDVIRECQEAVNVRQNIVHNGQHSIDNKAVRRHLRSIRKLCKLLATLTRTETR